MEELILMFSDSIVIFVKSSIDKIVAPINLFSFMGVFSLGERDTINMNNTIIPLT